jgi:protein-disulfide isomerase
MQNKQNRQNNHSKSILIGLVLVMGLMLACGLPSISQLVSQASTSATATLTAESTNLEPVINITPKTINAKVDGVHLGDSNAPVKVDVYEDFRCSACLYYTQTVEPQIIQNYVETGKIYYTFHSFIVIDGNDGTDASLRSANAALCASEQGHFWDYHDTLFANQVTEDASLFTDARLSTMAQNLKLDMTAFDQCYQAKKYTSTIQADITQGENLKINGTPSIFVNGVYVPNFQQTSQAIDNAVAGK